MRLQSIWLHGFRNHQDRVIEFDPKITLVQGNNGTGKTNILEAIYLLATGTSFRAEKQEDMVAWNAELARVKGRVVHRIPKAQVTNYQLEDALFGEGDDAPRPAKYFDDVVELEVIVTRGMVQGKAVPRKRYLVNGVSRLQKTFVGNLRAVLFGPEDLNLISGSPQRRRRFWDGLLIQVDREYRAALTAYEQGLRRRNKLLHAIQERKASRSQLFFWNQLLIKNGNILTKARQAFVDYMNFESRGMEMEGKAEMMYDLSGISEARLQQYAEEEIMAGKTLVGPHRDDFSLRFEFSSPTLQSETKDLRSFGSRGQQRMGVLWLKLGELGYIEKLSGVKPVLLLDDILSELDAHHRDLVMTVANRQQTVMTSAEKEMEIVEMPGNVVALDAE